MLYKKLIAPSLFVVLVMLTSALLFLNATLTETDKLKEEFELYYKIYSLNIPEHLEFANERVPLNDFDVQERYDRELLTNVYWQSQTLLMLKRANRFFPAISSVLKQNNIPDDMKYLAVSESGLQNVSSPAGAVGYWQLLDKTAKMYGLEITEEVDERYHLEKSTEAACKYFNEAYKEFNNWALVAASYNMGIDGVKKQLQNQNVTTYWDLYLNTETSRYMLRNLAIKEILEHPKLFGFNLTSKHLYAEIKSVKIRVDKSIPNLALFASSNGSNYKFLKNLNPWLRKPTLTVADGKVYYISLPKDQMLKMDFAEKILNDTISMDDLHPVISK